MLLTFKVSGAENLDKIATALGGSSAYFNKPTAMVPAVRAFGYGIVDNWRSEGGRVGGWKPLKEYTITERLARGYGAGPKLQQSGGLRAGAIVPFAQWPDGQMRFSTLIPATTGRASPRARPGWQSKLEGEDPELDIMQSGPTTVRAGLYPRSFVASVIGAKALNQTGGNLPWARPESFDGKRLTGKGWTHLPARPFWFFDTRMIDEAAKGIVGLFEFETFKNLPLVTGLSPALAYKRAITYGN